MRVHRVHVPALQAGSLTLTGKEAKHLAQVLRARPGDKVAAFDGRGLEAQGEILETDPFRVTLNLAEPEPSEVEASLKITLAVGLLKGDKLTGVVRQGTELGVSAFQFFSSQFGDVPELSKNKLERLRRVAQEAAKQSGRSVVPQVEEPVKLEDLMLGARALVAHPYASQTLSEFSRAEGNSEIILITGPEGGLSEAEVRRLEEKGATPVRLGARILRAETAPVALVAALLLPEAL